MLFCGAGGHGQARAVQIQSEDVGKEITELDINIPEGGPGWLGRGLLESTPCKCLPSEEPMKRV